ncbi:MAG: hypothetical protein IPO08_23335 [Xanthomonadales bacterium]|nr:hypothetical protein [Xanthomonadales bacterium]
MNDRAANPFAVTKSAPSNAVAESHSQREAQEVQAMMVIAKRFPRDQMAAMDRILQACTRPTLAEGALYSYNKGGSDVTGPSIRLAEAIAQSWGNLQFGIRELSQSNGESSVEAFAWDTETNTRQVKVFQVPHIRFSRKGATRLEDPRDIYELIANQGARRLRACILGVIPGDVVECAVKQCETTLTTTADTSPDAIKKMIDAFAAFDVTQANIEESIQRRIDTITPALMVRMKKIYASLRDGMSSPSDWFKGAESNRAAPSSVSEQKAQAAQSASRQRAADAGVDAASVIAKLNECVDATADRDAVTELWSRLSKQERAAVGPGAFEEALSNCFNPEAKQEGEQNG